MAKNADWREDAEALGIAMKLVDKFETIFEDLDLTKIKFVRNLASQSQKVGEVKACGFPYDIDSPYAYYLIIANNKWKELTEAQQTLSIMHLLYAIAPQGTDESSNNYAKLRRHDVQDFNVILAAAGGRYDWMTPGVTDIKNPLLDDEDALDEKLAEQGVL